MARIESLTTPQLYTKTELMAREILTEDSRHVYYEIFPNNNPRNNNNGGFEFQYRTLKDGEMKTIYPASASGTPESVNYPNAWIWLKMSGGEFTEYWSADGKAWKTYTNFTLGLYKKVHLGLAVTSHNTKETATAVFKDISFAK